jgi:glycosyltransferase involved in cell wall biosynthesis
VRDGRRPRVAFLRGSYLNAFESQYLELLLDEYDITAIHAGYRRFDVDAVGLPKRRVRCLDFLDGLVPHDPFGRRLPNPFKRLGFEEVMLGLRRALAGFDLVHTAEPSFFFSWQAARLESELGFGLVTTQCEVVPHWHQGRRGLARRAAFVRERSAVFHARSERARQALLTEGAEPDRVHVVGHGVDLERFRPGVRDVDLMRRVGVEDGAFVVLFVGRLVWTKGIFALADAAALLLRDPSFRRLKPVFVMAGGGPERARLERRLDLLGLADHFRLLGARPYAEIPDLHRLADLFVLPSIPSRTILEQFGIALVEAMATGTPVVSTHCGAIDEVVDEAGVLVQPNDALRLAEAIRTLALDRAESERLGRAGLERACSKFSREEIARGLSAIYRAALERRGGA